MKLWKSDRGWKGGGIGLTLIFVWAGLEQAPAQTTNALPRIVRGPYLQCGTQTQIVVRWRTDIPTDSTVAYGTNPIQLNSAVKDADLDTEHQVVLSGLTPDTRYYYAVAAGDEILMWGPDLQFVTAPAMPKPVRIWAIGDSGTASVGVFGSHDVRDAYRAFTGSRPTDVWLMLGDNAYSVGTDAEYQVAVFETYPDLLRSTVLWPTIGNHETYAPYSDGRFAYLDIFTLPQRGEAGGVPSGTPYYYSFNYGNIHFVCLDSEVSERNRGGAMLNWLEADLAAHTNDWLIAYWHTPPYSKGSHNSDSTFDSGGRMFQMRTNVVPLLESHGVDLVLCGHSHNYERSFLLHGHYGISATLQRSMILDGGSGRAIESGAYLKSGTGPVPNQGAVYVVAGSSGWATFTTGRHPAMFMQLLELGSMVIDITGQRLDARFVRETGAVDDYFTIIKGAQPEPFKLVGFNMNRGNAILHWRSQAGKLYQVERTDRLDPPQWLPTSPSLPASGATTSWTNPIPAQTLNSYFRVVEVSD